MKAYQIFLRLGNRQLKMRFLLQFLYEKNNFFKKWSISTL